jgi:hypothetical protein
MRVRIFKEKITETEEAIVLRNSKIDDLAHLEAEMEEKKMEIGEQYKNLAVRES